MTQVAVLLAPGFEEMEAIAPVDLLRRADIDVDIIGLNKEVTGARGITVTADKVLKKALTGYDLVVVPGGQPGASNLKKNETVIKTLKAHYAQGKKIAAICAGPIALDEAGILKDKNYVCFPGAEEEITSGKLIKEAVVVKDGNVTTARGAGAAYEFGLTLIDWLGEDADRISKDIQYTHVLNSYQ